MKIGIDLRALQTGHKYRGIGEVAKQTTNRILELASKDDDVSFLFYEYDDTGNDPKELLDIPAGITYEIIKVGRMPEKDKGASKASKAKRNAKWLYGEPISGSEKSDVFLQFDYAFGVPRNTRTVLIKHDLIPYIFWDKYFTSAWVHFKHKAARTTLRTAFGNYRFMRILRRSLKNAGVIITVSENTKKDLTKYFNVDERKIKTAHLGVDLKPAKTNDYNEAKMPTKPYILFVGAGDARRRVEDAVAAYNNLKADGYDIQFALVGENFQSPNSIPTVAVRNAVLASSYKEDILTLGYVDDNTKQRLFQNAIAYVYPTKYEGFGIPVLEAMLLGCPVVTYKNSSIPEVGGKHALYATDWLDIKDQIEQLIAMPAVERHATVEEARAHAEQFTWDKTASIIYAELTRK